MLTSDCSVCVISVIRVVSLFAIDNTNPTCELHTSAASASSHTNLPQGTLVGIANWSSVEFAIAVMCGSLPTLRPLVNWIRPKTYTSQPAPKLELAHDTIGSGGKKPWHGKKDHFARMHGLETDNSTYAMTDMETLIEGSGASMDQSRNSHV
jgi:hypothetical protein